MATITPQDTGYEQLLRRWKRVGEPESFQHFGISYMAFDAGKQFVSVGISPAEAMPHYESGSFPGSRVRTPVQVVQPVPEVEVDDEDDSIIPDLAELIEDDDEDTEFEIIPDTEELFELDPALDMYVEVTSEETPEELDEDTNPLEE